MTEASFGALAREAAARYPANDRFARHFAHGKLTGDPVFAYILAQQLIPAGARLLDLGCGQGLLAALLDVRGPRPGGFHGIDLRAKDIARARAAMPWARWVEGDIRSSEFSACDVVVILDVLHYVGPEEQRRVLERARDALAGGGTLLVRVAGADRSVRFRFTLFTDRVATVLRGGGWPRLHPRTLAEWRALLEGLGFRVRTEPMSHGTPFANVLCVARYDGSSGTTR